MESTSSHTFGQWLKQRRKELDLTQQTLANHVGCTVTMIRKIEADLRQPSRQLASRLAEHLQLPSEQQAAFVQLARQRGATDLPAATKNVRRSSQGLHNLPPQLSPLVGRAEDVENVCELLERDTVRLVTISGPPGVGKSRLALQVAAELQSVFPDGVFVVPLESITPYPALLRAAIEQILGVTPAPGESADEALLAFLRERQLLLLLDTFDHLTEVAPSLTDLLVACPRLKLLVASSTVLRLSDEHVYPLAPLPCPDLEHLPALAELARVPAVELFVEQLSLVKRSFALTEANAAAVAAICVRLDGLPLALKLAAVRGTLLSPAQLLARLNDPLALLTQGAIDAPERHQSLSRAIAWNYDLLEPAEQHMLMHLAVFNGGCTLEAIEAVSALQDQPQSEIELIDTLMSLIRKSLVLQEEDIQGSVRFRMLEPIRAYALERLRQSDQAHQTRDRHARYYLGLAETLLNGHAADQPDWLPQEQGNLNTATQWLNDSSCTVSVPLFSAGTPQVEHHSSGPFLARIIPGARAKENVLLPRAARTNRKESSGYH